MRVAALYDVHGNLPALDAVLAEVDADAIVVGGDVVGGVFCSETVERLRALGERALWLRGNAERELVEPPKPREGGPPPGELERIRAELTGEQIEFLYGLPTEVRLDVDGIGAVLFCHATPWNDLDLVTPLTTDERVSTILDGVDADLIVAGHTHMQDRRPRWVNAGSVGMPYEDDDGAFWAEFGPDVRLRRTSYDRRALGEYEYPSASREEAANYFEGLVGD